MQMAADNNEAIKMQMQPIDSLGARLDNLQIKLIPIDFRVASTTQI